MAGWLLQQTLHQLPIRPCLLNAASALRAVCMCQYYASAVQQVILRCLRLRQHIGQQQSHRVLDHGRQRGRNLPVYLPNGHGQQHIQVLGLLLLIRHCTHRGLALSHGAAQCAESVGPQRCTLCGKAVLAHYPRRQRHMQALKQAEY